MPVRNIESELETLAVLRTAEPRAASARLQKALGDKVNVVVAKAASVTADLRLRELIPTLCDAFERLLINPRKTDPQCWAKAAIAKALKDLEHTESAIFLKGVRHVQMEPVWGGQEDTATTLRANCALALLQCTDLLREDKLWAVMRLLTEASPSLRKDAAVALESLEGREAALMLRIKARMGDSDHTVTGQIFESLLHVEGAESVPFVLEFLNGPNPEVREEAALALGASRVTAAVIALINLFSQPNVLLDQELLFRAISISRSENAIQFLLDVVRNRRMREAMEALDALALYRDSAEIRQKIAEAAAVRPESEIQNHFHRLFSGT